MRFLLLFAIFSSSLTLHAQEVVHSHSIHHAFIENKGQWPDQVLFKTSFQGGNMWVEQGKVMFHLQDYSDYRSAHAALNTPAPEELTFKQKLVHLNFKGANNVTTINKSKRAPHYYNYFVGADKSKWASNVGAYGEFILEEIYNGIDLRFIEKEEELKYEFIVAPQIDPNIIKLEFVHQDKLFIDKQGNLVVRTELGDIIEKAPYAYQIVNGKIKEVSCAFKIANGIVEFDLGDYNPHVELVIDPTLIFATYCGAVSDNFGMTATYGYDGTAYNGGMVYGNSYPTPDPSAYNTTSNMTVVDVGIATTDAFISKYNPDGTTMLWSTFFGGGDNTQGTEVPHSLICDLDNNIYVYGVTSALDFPIVNGFQPNHAGGTTLSVNFNGTNFGNVGTDIFVAKFSENGHDLLGSTYVGGSQNDGVNYKLTSGIYNTVAAYDSLTTNYGDQFRGEIMLDELNNIVVASCTRSTDFPTMNPFQAVNAGQQDGVVFKIVNDFSSLIFSSYFGGSNNDACYSVKLDDMENVVFVGGTSSADLPNTAGGYQDSYQGGKADGFVARATSDGATLLQASYLGMGQYDQAFFLEIDRLDNIFVVGQSVGGNFPVSPGVYSNPGSSQFIAKMTTDLTTVVQSTVFGSGSANFDISPSAFLVDICGNMYVSGWGANILQGTPIGAMPVTLNAFQQTAPNGFDFYLIVIEREFEDLLYGTYMGGPVSNEHVDGGTSRFDKNGVVYQGVCGGCGGNSDFPTTPGAWSDQNLASNCNALVFKFDFNLIPNAEFTVDNNIGCASFEVTFDNFSSDSDSYIWDFGDGEIDSVTFEPTYTFTDPGVYEVYLYVTDSICLITDTAQITIIVYDSLSLSTIVDQELCVPIPIDFIAYTNGIGDEFIWSGDVNFSDTLNSNLADSIFTFTPTEPGTYYVQVSNAGCSLIDSVFVDFIGSSIELSANDSICVGESTIVTATNTNPSLTFTYEWEPDAIIVNPSITNSVEVDPIISQYVYVTATSSNGCVVSDSIQIHVGDVPDPLINATSSEYEVAEGAEVTLTASPSGYSYMWIPITGLSHPTSQETQAIVDESTTYTVFITDGICTKTAQVFVKTYAFICGEPYVFVPNAFSPNGDGENDILYVEGPFEEMIFRIYDRWGELVFESFDRVIGWDGTFKGRRCDPDVYDYYLDVKCINDQETIVKGNITLLK